MINFQFITHQGHNIGYIDGARLALAGGCRWIQFRAKELSDTDAYKIAKTIQIMCKSYGATFIIDDRVAMAKIMNADGVHLGHSDMPLKEARELLGPNYIIGGTANTIEDVSRLYEDGADYIGCGPFRFTSTKHNLAPLLGIDGYRRIVHAMRYMHICVPIVAIGGITAADISSLLAAGIDGVAVSGSIINADNPEAEARKIASYFESNHPNNSI